MGIKMDSLCFKKKTSTLEEEANFKMFALTFGHLLGLLLVWVDIDSSVNLSLQADKRAHHNALERKRRDHIKDSFSSLRDSVPALQGEKVSKVSNRYFLLSSSD